jgi:hypothetical protein
MLQGHAILLQKDFYTAFIPFFLRYLHRNCRVRCAPAPGRILDERGFSVQRRANQ